jgi:hypothetical protein
MPGAEFRWQSATAPKPAPERARIGPNRYAELKKDQRPANDQEAERQRTQEQQRQQQRRRALQR